MQRNGPILKNTFIKKFILIFILAVGFSETTKAQSSGVPDTLVYLKSIIANKATYIGKPFSTLQAALQINIQMFTPIADIPSDMSKETSTFFSFYFPQSMNEFHLIFPQLSITWQNQLNANQSSSLFLKYNGGAWAQEVSTFYSTAVIKNISLVEEPSKVY